jgi:hypothetical protein
VPGGWVEAFSRQVRQQSPANGRTSLGLHVNLASAVMTAPAYARVYDPDQITQAIQRQEPVVIVCSLGPWDDASEHAMVVTGVSLGYMDAAHSKLGIVSVDVLDPADPPDKTVQKPGEYLKVNLRAIYSHSIVKEIFESENKAVRVTS